MSMKIRLAFVLALTAPLPSCAPFAPAEIADTTVADEKAAIGFELAYTAASRAGASLAKAGLIDPDKFVALDARAYTALLAVRAAYRTGNARDLSSAVTELETAIRAINSIMESAQ